MTADDIAFAKRSYAEAKSKSKQIKILADLFDTTQGEVREMLGVKFVADKRKGKYPVAFKREIALEIQSGKPGRQVAIAHGIHPSLAYEWVKRYGD